MANGSDTLTLVPPRRLGQLLVEHRTSAGLSVAEIADQTSLLGSELAVEHLEAGKLPLTDQEMMAVTAAYGVQVDTLVPQRSQLIVDLNERTLAVGDRSVAFSGPGSQMTDELLTQYLSLVRALRSLPTDAEVVLRERDLGALSGALVLPPDDIESRLHELMEGQPLQLRQRARWLSLRPLVPALGILVGATAIGGVILASPTQSEASGTQTASQSSDGASESGLDLAGSRSIPTVITRAPATSTPAAPVTAAANDGAAADVVGVDDQAVERQPVEPPPAVDLQPVAEVQPAEPQPADPQPADPAVTAPPPTTPAIPSTTESVEAVEADGGLPQVDSSAARFEAALDLIAYPWESKLPGWTITLEPRRHGYRGLTNVAERRIEIYDVAGMGERELAHIIAHEIGHAVDVTYNDMGTRSLWLQSRGIDPNHPWFTGDGLTDFSVGAGDFAESFAHWQVGQGEHSNLGGPPTSEQIILLAELSL